MLIPVTDEAFRKSYQGQYVPEHVRGGLMRYINEGVPTGGFLELVLSNDLFGAMGKADDENRRNLYAICCWLYGEAPSACKGSPEAYQHWLAAMAALRRGEPVPDDVPANTRVMATGVYHAVLAAKAAEAS